MCGITGIISSDSSFPLYSAIAEMNHILSHRGPDDEGFLFAGEHKVVPTGSSDTAYELWTSSLPWRPETELPGGSYALALGHRRLSIVDVHEGGHQPLCDSSRRYWIVFNGELYNHTALRKELEEAGHSFYGHSDTEVLLHAYMQWGTECLSRFDGMWAFAIYDHLTNTVFAARDRFGVKPFYYSRQKSFFAFASEIKALLSVPGLQTRVHASSAYDYLILGKSEEQAESLFEGIHELMPGTFLLLKVNSLQFEIKTYYQLNTDQSWKHESSFTHKKNVEEIYELLKSAVYDRMQADVEVGACLSGGLDSSAIVSIMQKVKDHADPTHLFTSVFPGTARDEKKWAAILAENTNSIWHTSQPTASEFADKFSKLIYAQDIPFYSMTVFTHYHLMSEVNKAGIKVVLDGQGADELFAGYQPHFSIYLRDAIRNRDHRTLSILMQRSNAGFSSKKEALRFIAKTNAFRVFPKRFYHSYRKENFENNFYDSSFWNQHYERFESYYKEYSNGLNTFLKGQFAGADLKKLLRVGDRNSMQHAVEVRTPFADSLPLIEKVFSISAKEKIHLNTSKYLLRSAMHGHMPELLRTRKDKIGFATPEDLWLKSLESTFRDLLEESKDPFLDINGLKNHWKQMVTQSAPLKIDRLWRILNYLWWKKEFKM